MLYILNLGFSRQDNPLRMCACFVLCYASHNRVYAGATAAPTRDFDIYIDVNQRKVQEMSTQQRLPRHALVR